MMLKVCGMRYPQNIAEVGTLGPDLMGFIFYPPSPRFAGRLRPEELACIPPSVRRVGVFVNASPEYIMKTVARLQLDLVQLHGDEPPELCRELGRGTGVIKAFGIADRTDLGKVDRYEGTCSCYVFDTKTPGYGGSGRKFDHRVLSSYRGQTPFLLSGGIGPDDRDWEEVTKNRQFAGFDINSRFETAPGVKDPALVKRFMDQIKTYGNEQDRPTF